MMAAVVDAVVLAAGASRRMAPHHKLLARGADGRALIAVTVAGLQDSKLRSLVVVTGSQGAAVALALAGARVRIVPCPGFAGGLSHSLRAGLRALPDDGDAVLICLGDMPLVDAGVVAALLAAWRPGTIVVPVHDGQRGNPVLWDRGFVPELLALSGDAGARAVLSRHAGRVVPVSLATDAVLRDADTPAALRALPGGPWRTPGGDLI